MQTIPTLRSCLASVAAAVGMLPFAATAADIPPNVTLAGETNAINYVLTTNGAVSGNGVFEGTFNTAGHNLSVNTHTNTGTLTFDGVISGSATSPLPNVTILAGSNTVVLNGNNTFTGDLILDSGTLRLGHANALGDNAGQFRTFLSGVTLDLNGLAIAGKTASLGANLVIENTSGSAASWGGAISNNGVLLNFSVEAGAMEVGGAITHAGAGGVTKTGSGTLTVSGNNTSLNAAWLLAGGTLRLASSNAVGAEAVVVSSNGTTLDLNGQNAAAKPIQVNATSFTVANASTTSASWSGQIDLDAAGSTLVFDASAGNLTVNGAIKQNTGISSVEVRGTNATTFTSGANTYTGNTVLSNGNLTLADNSFLEFVIGGSGTNNAITGTGSIVLDGDFGFNLTGASTSLGDLWTILDVTNLTESYGANFQVLGFTLLEAGLWQRTNSGTVYEFSQTSGQLSVVPEPGTVMLLLAGGGVLFACLRRRRV